MSGPGSPQHLLEAMGRAAPGYNRVGPPFYGHVAAGLVELVDIRPGGDVLDAATGPGIVLAEVARLQPSAVLTGIDLSSPEIEVARVRLAALRRDATLRVMDAEQLDFAFAGADEWLANAWTHGERRALEAMPPESRRAFESELPSRARGCSRNDGLLHWRPEVVFAVASKS